MKRIACVIVGLLVVWSVAAAQVVTRDLVVKYDFTAAVGEVIADRAGSADPLDLQITDLSKVTWLQPGLRVTAATVIKTNSPRTKLDAVRFFADGFTIEAWVKPLNNTQSGPARIVTFSQDSGQRNFTLGQSGDSYNMRFRTSVNPNNGTSPSTSTPVGSIAENPVLQHVVYTRDNQGTAQFYVDKVAVATEAVPGDGSNWVDTFDFGLFNETNYPVDDRTWLGDVFLVAIYSTVLTSAEIAQNFAVGPPVLYVGPGKLTLAWDANTEPDLAGYTIYVGEASGDYNRAYDVRLTADGWSAGCVAPYDPFKTECCEFTVKNLEMGKIYYFAATAYDKDENESAYSEELTHFMMSAPKNFRQR